MASLNYWTLRFCREPILSSSTATFQPLEDATLESNVSNAANL